MLLALPLVTALAPAGAQAGLPGAARPDPSFDDGRGYVTLELGGQSTIAFGAGSGFAQLLRDGTPNGGVANIGTPAGVGINAIVLPGPHKAVVAGSVGSNLYVSRSLLPPQRLPTRSRRNEASSR